MTGLIAARTANVLLGRTVPASRAGVLESFGQPAGAEDGAGALRLHEHLLQETPGTLSGAVELTPFRAGGRDFWWMVPAGPPGALDRAVGLRHHTVVAPPAAFREQLAAALGLLSAHPWAFAMVERFISNFALLRFDRSPGATPVTSCSVPDFPLSVFLSGLAARHIPPHSVADRGTPLLLAENVFHESVHQFVNHQLLTRPVLDPAYDSADSPRIPIYWRRDGDGMPRTWELDRVLHAAMVYAQLVDGRYEVLGSDLPSDADREVVLAASRHALGALASLCDALAEHVDAFQPYGAFLVGRLVEAARHRCDLLRWRLDDGSGPRPPEVRPAR